MWNVHTHRTVMHVYQSNTVHAYRSIRIYRNVCVLFKPVHMRRLGVYEGS